MQWWKRNQDKVGIILEESGKTSVAHMRKNIKKVQLPGRKVFQLEETECAKALR